MESQGCNPIKSADVDYRLSKQRDAALEIEDTALKQR